MRRRLVINGPADRSRIPRPRASFRTRADWYAIHNATAPIAEVLIYDEIGYWGITAEDFVRDLQGVTAGSIDLRINSPGGEVFDGVAIMNALRSHPASVTAYVDGLAASAASFILQAGDRRVMRPQSRLMIHDALTLAIGNAEELRTEADQLDAVSDSIADVYAERGEGNRARWRGLMRATTWYSAEEAVEAGLADAVDSGTATSNRMPRRENTWDLSIFGSDDRAGGGLVPEPQARREVVVVARTAVPPPTVPAQQDGQDEGVVTPPAVAGPAPEAPADPDAERAGVEWSSDLSEVFASAMRPPAEAEMAAEFRAALGISDPEPIIPAIEPTEFYNAILEGLAS